MPRGQIFGSGTGIGNTNGARRVGHVSTFGGVSGDVKLTGWAQEGTDVDAGVGGVGAKHAGGGGAVGSAASAVVGVGGDAVGENTRTGDVVVGCIGDVRSSGARVARSRC